MGGRPPCGCGSVVRQRSLCTCLRRPLMKVWSLCHRLLLYVLLFLLGLLHVSEAQAPGLWQLAALQEVLTSGGAGRTRSGRPHGGCWLRRSRCAQAKPVGKPEPTLAPESWLCAPALASLPCGAGAVLGMEGASGRRPLRQADCAHVSAYCFSGSTLKAVVLSFLCCRERAHVLVEGQ